MNPVKDSVCCLDDFAIDKAIHHGAFGTVSRAVCKSNGKVYALKQVSLSGMKRVEREETIDEARLLSRLHHPHIIKHHRSFIENNKLCILMDYADGGSLYRHIKDSKNGCLTAEKTWKILLQCLLALDYLLTQKIIHRDIKSLNILLKSDGEALLGDFGIARALSRDSDFAKTLLGTPFYLSPELCEDMPYNEKSDVWALGVVIYECITGELPFFARNEGALIRKILKGVYKTAARCPVDLQEVISKCLIYDHRKRPTASLKCQNSLPGIVGCLYEGDLLKLPCVKKRAQQLKVNLNLNIELEKKKMPPQDDLINSVVSKKKEGSEESCTNKQGKEDLQKEKSKPTVGCNKVEDKEAKKDSTEEINKNTCSSSADKKQGGEFAVASDNRVTDQASRFSKIPTESNQFEQHQAHKLNDEDVLWRASYSAPTFARKRCPDLMATLPLSHSRSTSTTSSETTKQDVNTSYEQSVASTRYVKLIE